MDWLAGGGDVVGNVGIDWYGEVVDDFGVVFIEGFFVDCCYLDKFIVIVVEFVDNIIDIV